MMDFVMLPLGEGCRYNRNRLAPLDGAGGFLPDNALRE